jgi:hypothetical protein
MKTIICTIIALVSMALHSTAQKVTPTDLKVLEGNWVGTLTYLDYKSNQPFTMPANTTLRQSNDNPNIYLRSIGYSTEPHANQKDSLIISKDGSMIDDFKVVSNKKLKNGTVEIITEKKDVDGNDNKPALIRHYLTITANTYTNRKDVQFEGTTKWIVRHTYSFKKVTK